VQRARPSYNPRGTCPRWAESPAAPSETKLCTRQFHITKGGGKECSSQRGSHKVIHWTMEGEKNVLHTEIHTNFVRTRMIYSRTRKNNSHFCFSFAARNKPAHADLKWLHNGMFVPSFLEPLKAPNFPSARERKRKGARRPGEEKKI
jgi:hypothetical protein